MGLDIARIKLLCFDVDGTLSDTDDQLVARISRLVDFLGRIHPGIRPDVVARRLVMAIETPANILFNIPDRLGFDRQVVWLIQRMNALGIGKRTPPFWTIPDVLPMIDRLVTRYPLAIVSARDEQGTRAFLDDLQLTPKFKAIITSQTCTHTKPFPDPIVEAARQAGVSPSECLMIGDTTVDILAARRAGAQSVGVLCGFGEERELRQAGAGEIIQSTALLEGLLPETRAL